MRSIFLALFLCIFNYVQGQVVYSATQPEMVDTSLIKSFENDEERTDLTPYTHKRSKNIYTGANTFTIDMLKYNGWEGEYGDFNVIEISGGRPKGGNTLSTTSNNKSKVFTLKNDNGWDYFYTENNLNGNTEEPFKVIQLNDACKALVFTGMALSNEPPFLTVVVLNDYTSPKLVYNVQAAILDMKSEGSETSFTLLMNTVEYDDNNIPYNIPNNTPIIKTLTFGNGKIAVK